MNVFLKFLFSKSKKSLWVLTMGLLAVSSVNTVANIIDINDTNTTVVDFNGTVNSLNITKNGSIIVDNNFSSIYTNELNGHFIVNDGNISITNENNSSGAEAAGIYTYNSVADSNITNSGNIATTADSNNSYSYADGIYTDGNVSNSSITNSGNITANAKSNSSEAYADGIYTYNSVADSNITNSGDITANAKSNDSWANAAGIITVDVADSNITNSGNITANADSNNYYAYADGIDAYNSVADSNITNSGTITANAKSNSSEAYADGIYTDGNVSNSSIINSGNINLTAKSNSSDANTTAAGIDIGSNINNSNIINSGNISANADSNSTNAKTSAYGIYSKGNVSDSNIVNSGAITADALNNGSDAQVDGILIDGNVTDSNIKNSGTITISADSNGSSAQAEAFGIHALHSVTDSNITNSGTITMNAKSNGSNSEAFGVCADDINNSNIINNGTINISADSNGSNYDAVGGICALDINNANIANSGTITANIKSNGSNSYDIIGGIYTFNINNANIANSGTITANADSNGSRTDAYGIYTIIIRDSNITNSGTITAKINNKFDKSGYAIHVQIGDVNSTITNTKTGKLYGNIYINGDAKVTNKGLIALPYNANDLNASAHDNRAYIGGNLTNTGTIQIGMLTDGNISNTQYSKLSVKGTATFNVGSVLDVNVLSASTNSKLLIGETLTNVVSADTNLTVNSLSVTDNSILLDFNYTKVGNNIDLGIVKGLSVLKATTQNGSNSNILSTAKALDNIINNGIPDSMDDFYTKLNTLSTDQAVAKAVDSTLSYAAVSNIDASNAIVDNVFGIVENQGFGGLNSGDKLFSEKRVWIKPFGNFGKQEDRDNIHGFDFNSQGVGIGAQGAYSNNAYAGIGLFYNRANVNVNGADQSSDLNIYTALIYGQTPIAHGKVKLRYKASASWQDTNSNRYIALTNETAKASYTSNLYALDVKALKDFQMNNKLLLEPIIGATYKYIHTPSYKESGSSTNLSVNSSNTKRLTTYLGTKAYYQLNETSTLNAKISLGYDVTHDDISTISAYSAAPNDKFTTNGIDNGRWSYLASIGYKKQITNQDDINFRYEYYGEGSSYHNNAVSFNYLHKF